jgi:GrpB-like predicted nucleotidyltransferase (UPF0157 family)
MIKQLDILTTKELGQLFPITIVGYSAQWPLLFAEEKKGIERNFGADQIIRIEHIGSTAVPGLSAKPTIDILMEVIENIDDNLVISTLEKMGYHYIPKPENPAPHMMFVKGYTSEGFKGQTYHIHVRYPGDWDEPYFRDYLIQNPKLAREYLLLKYRLARKFKNDRDGYTESKTLFVKMISSMARKKLITNKECN